MKFRIEKETRWSQYKTAVVENYYVWADGSCLASCETLDDAMNVLNKVKDSYTGNTTETVYEIEVN
jgi:hypothetical protein